MTAPDMIEMMCSTKYYGILDEKTTPEEKTEYGLPQEFTQEEILQLCSLRSTLAANSFQRYQSITIAKNVSLETVSQLMENSADLPGIDIAEDYLRYYNKSEYFAQIIGYTGQISAEELAQLREVNKSYDSTDIVGKVGLEKEMETSLHAIRASRPSTLIIWDVRLVWNRQSNLRQGILFI